MNNNDTTPSNEELQVLSEDILSIAKVVDNLETAARIDATPKVERLQVMEKALNRDVAEAAGSEQGADSTTVAKLYSETRRDTTNLKQEMAVIGQGNPTTVSAVGDAAMEVIETAANKISDKFSSDSA